MAETGCTLSSELNTAITKIKCHLLVSDVKGGRGFSITNTMFWDRPTNFWPKVRHWTWELLKSDSQGICAVLLHLKRISPPARSHLSVFRVFWVTYFALSTVLGETSEMGICNKIWLQQNLKVDQQFAEFLCSCIQHVWKIIIHTFKRAKKTTSKLQLLMGATHETD